MTVSVIVPVYNTAKYVGACIESILAQTYADLDVVIVDDGSSDGSSEICQNFAVQDSRITLVRQENSGVSAARNLGVDIAKGEYIAFVDSDDTIHPKMIACLLALCSEYRAAAAFCACTHKPGEMGSKGNVLLYTPKEAILETLYQRGLDSSLCGKLFPAHAVKATRQDVGRRYEDLAVFFKIYEGIQGKIAATTAPLYYYRDNRDSFINNFSLERLHVLEVTQDIERHFSDDPQLSQAANDRRFSANYNMLVLATNAGLINVADGCWELIKKYRAHELSDSRVRIKNKLGALLSYLGRSTVLLIARLKYQ